MSKTDAEYQAERRARRNREVAEMRDALHRIALESGDVASRQLAWATLLKTEAGRRDVMKRLTEG